MLTHGYVILPLILFIDILQVNVHILFDYKHAYKHIYTYIHIYIYIYTHVCTRT